LPHQEQRARHLSGGNQQKVVLAKMARQELRRADLRRTDARAIDVGAKYEIYLLLNDLAARGGRKRS